MAINKNINTRFTFTLDKKLKEVYNLKLSNFADILDMSPQQFSYKINHKLSVLDICKISKFLKLNNDQIVNIFIKYKLE